MIGGCEMDRSNGRFYVGGDGLWHDRHEGLIEIKRYEDAYAVEIACAVCGESTWCHAPYWLEHGVSA